MRGFIIRSQDSELNTDTDVGSQELTVDDD